MFLLGLQAAAWRLPFLPTRAGLGSDLLRVNPELRTVTLARTRRPTASEELVAVPALTSTPPSCHLNRADERGNAQFLGPDPYFDDLVLHRPPTSALRVRRADRAHRRPRPTRRRSPACASAGCMVDGVVEAPNGAHFTSCAPDYERDEAFQKAYAGVGRSRGLGRRSATRACRRRRGRLPGARSPSDGR